MVPAGRARSSSRIDPASWSRRKVGDLGKGLVGQLLSRRLQAASAKGAASPASAATRHLKGDPDIVEIACVKSNPIVRRAADPSPRLPGSCDAWSSAGAFPRPGHSSRNPRLLKPRGLICVSRSGLPLSPSVRDRGGDIQHSFIQTSHRIGADV